MQLRVGPGPVFVYEWLITTRRGSSMRCAGFVAVILVGMVIVH